MVGGKKKGVDFRLWWNDKRKEIASASPRNDRGGGNDGDGVGKTERCEMIEMGKNGGCGSGDPGRSPGLNIFYCGGMGIWWARLVCGVVLGLL
jgi:hypothetical protein